MNIELRTDICPKNRQTKTYAQKRRKPKYDMHAYRNILRSRIRVPYLRTKPSEGDAKCRDFSLQHIMRTVYT